RQLGVSFPTAHAAAQGDGAVGDPARPPDGQPCRKLPQPHERTYRSVFGPLTIRRAAYGSREGQKIAWVPLDARLGLPAGEFSYLLEDWSLRFCLRAAFPQAPPSLPDFLGLRPTSP